MTLAQNHRQPLSGNRIIPTILSASISYRLYLSQSPNSRYMQASTVSKILKLQAYLFILLLVISCGAANKTTSPTDKLPGDGSTALDTPVIDSTKIIVDIEVKPDSLDRIYPNNRRDTYQISYALPLFLSEYPNVQRSNKYFSQISMDYWWGAKLAYDTLEAIGLNAQVNVYDTRNDSAQIAKIGERIGERGTHLLVGPVFPDGVKQLVPICNEQGVNIISPLARAEECEDYSNRVIFSKPSIAASNQYTAEYIHKKYDSTYPVFIFCRNVSYEKSEALFYQEALSKHFESVTLEVIKSNYVSKGQLSGDFPDSSLVIITSEKETYVTSVLAETRRSLKDFVVFGHEKWLEFQAIDFDAWERLNMHFVSSMQIDYCNELTQDFVKHYRKVYHAEPSKFAISGYSDALYFGLHLNLFGTNFQRYFGEVDLRLPSGNLDFAQTTGCDAFFNQQIQILKLKDHELVVAP